MYKEPICIHSCAAQKLSVNLYAGRLDALKGLEKDRIKNAQPGSGVQTLQNAHNLCAGLQKDMSRVRVEGDGRVDHMPCGFRQSWLRNPKSNRPSLRRASLQIRKDTRQFKPSLCAGLACTFQKGLWLSAVMIEESQTQAHNLCAGYPCLRQSWLRHPQWAGHSQNTRTSSFSLPECKDLLLAAWREYFCILWPPCLQTT